MERSSRHTTLLRNNKTVTGVKYSTCRADFIRARAPAIFEIAAVALLVLWLLAEISGYTLDGALDGLLWLAGLAVMLRWIWRNPPPPAGGLRRIP